MHEMLSNYWGDMLKLSATTIWKLTIPKSGIEHYSMYLDKYLKSLCHAWGAVPIYLLGRYCLGVHDERIVVPAVQLVVGHLSI